MSRAYETMRLHLTWPLVKKIVTVPKISFGYLITSRCGVSTSCKPVKRRNERNPKLPADWHTLSWEERLADTVTPLWRMNYEKQLQWKQDQQHKILLEMTKQLAQDSMLPFSNDLRFPLLSIVPSPVRDGYRNKSTFSVNKGKDGNPKTVGFYIGNGRTGNIVCVHGDHLLNMPSKHSMVARYYEDFIRRSPLRPCILFHDGGHWREITIRTSSAGHTMAIVYFHPQNLRPEDICIHKAALVEYFAHGPGAVCQLDSLYFQESTMTRCSNEQSPYQLLHGQPYIFEEVLGFKFRISADSFFQVNRGAAEALYKTVAELNRACVGGTLLDVCCGTGAIGISLSPQMERVIGIELIEQAVEDAKFNAALNRVNNCQFFSGKAEVVLPNMMPTLNSDGGLTAVVNPSRAGLHYRVVRALRNHPAIRRLVYISCKPDGEAMRNFRELCSGFKRNITGEAFKPTVAVPVDLFPHTTHCELVLVFER
ncbi:tRNA (uracil(54)-C(5))-methyltransferase homolog-B [Pimephales promelas]|uniref:tRNA (uracil(54)-C(5))-methyltransferase homolog-B n=1 Tax=Pimephales promelas TaxID=90988 RepID=UPI001955684A|nr:tRNA (uracil(54)-C(5))-methyltransferase homolog-B [Pimephales promelas]